MGLEGRSRQALINSLCAKINEFNEKLNIPKTLKEFGINEDEFKEKVDRIAELAVGDACTGSNPERSILRIWRSCLPAHITELKLTFDDNLRCGCEGAKQLLERLST